MGFKTMGAAFNRISGAESNWETKSRYQLNFLDLEKPLTLCCGLELQKVHPAGIEAFVWGRKGFRGHCLEATGVVVESMRMWSVEHCLSVRASVFERQKPQHQGPGIPRPGPVPKAASGQDVHGGPNTLERAQAVAELLLRVAGGAQALNRGTGVLDVAGGTGLLSLALALRGVRATVVDPRRSAGCLPSRARKMMRKSGVGSLLVACRAWFGGRLQGADDSFSGSGDAVPACDEALVAGCSALVALHPDEATEAVVDAALRLRRPFVVVPCCVFARLFPTRTLDGRAVATLPEFREFLRRKHPSIREEILPFAGANVALYAPLCDVEDAQKELEGCGNKNAAGGCNMRRDDDGSEVDVAHLAVLQLQSPVLKAMLRSDMQEAKTLRVQVQTEFADVWPSVVRFWYGLPVDICSFEAAVTLRRAAQYYESEELKAVTGELLMAARPSAPRMALVAESLSFETDFADRAWSYLEAHPRELFASSAWPRLSEATVAELMRQLAARGTACAAVNLASFAPWGAGRVPGARTLLRQGAPVMAKATGLPMWSFQRLCFSWSDLRTCRRVSCAHPQSQFCRRSGTWSYLRRSVVPHRVAQSAQSALLGMTEI
ncbi:KEAP1 [Symbiodinium natans]|uniref:KEAP1 protein n=1 Tax=Symbiodinium natans TaxID=878477 RepID=A0A812V329_9DINO|nr:KEAP1 [Symbiodinium natans]